MARTLRTTLALGIWALSACSVPALDTAGAIRCGDQGLCPSGFTCAQGRCCPQGAAPSSCPLRVDGGANDAPALADAPADVAPADVAADARPEATADAPVDVPATTCDSDGGASQCGAGRECRQGICCDARAGAECPPGGVGAPCMAGGDCTRVRGAAAICESQIVDTLLLRGYCTARCDPRATPDPCGPGGVCMDFGLFGSCVARCTLGQPCRGDGSGDGYVCVNTDIGQNRTTPICVPDCANHAPCASGTVCYAASHGCVHTCAGACPLFTACSSSIENMCLRTCNALASCPTNYACSGTPMVCRAR